MSKQGSWIPPLITWVIAIALCLAASAGLFTIWVMVGIVFAFDTGASSTEIPDSWNWALLCGLVGAWAIPLALPLARRRCLLVVVGLGALVAAVVLALLSVQGL